MHDSYGLDTAGDSPVENQIPPHRPNAQARLEIVTLKAEMWTPRERGTLVIQFVDKSLRAITESDDLSQKGYTTRVTFRTPPPPAVTSC